MKKARISQLTLTVAVLTALTVRAESLVVGLSDAGAEDPGPDVRYYVDAVERAGHVPVIVGLTTDTNRLAGIVARLDALILTGGADVEPSRYGAVRSGRCGATDARRDAYEFALVAAARARRLPIAGICRGVQLLNVAFGGTLYQDLPSEFKPIAGGTACSHSVGRWDHDHTNPPAHTVTFVPGSRWAAVVGTEPLAVNSHHHQAVRRLAPGFSVAAQATDGVIEAIESKDYPAVGVQFHPESLISTGATKGFDRNRLMRVVAFLCEHGREKRVDGGAASVADGIVLAESTRPEEGRIEIPADASPSQRYAAQELSTYLRKTTGVKLPVDAVGTAGAAPMRAGTVIRLVTAKDDEGLGEDGFTLEAQRDAYVIRGSAKRGCLYGVYETLERFAGVRWYSSWCEKTPKADRIVVPAGFRDTQKPAFLMRQALWYDVEAHLDFAARNRFNGNSFDTSADKKVGEKYGGCSFRFGGGLGSSHTFNMLLPPSQYFDAHPEYYSLVKGKRLKDRTQLCLTNPDVLKLVTSNVLSRIRRDPDAKFYGVSQNDWLNYCECPACKAIDDEEESHAGTMVRFVNAIAEAVEKEFPNALIETLAYQYTRKPPKKTKLRRNVVPCLCTIECDFANPIATGTYKENVSFRDDIVGWAKQTDQLYLWDYTTDYYHYLCFFPDLDVLQANIRFFRDNHVKELFEQGAYQGHHAHMAEMKAWLLAKLMWNPEADVEALKRDFAEGFYGAAAPYVLEDCAELCEAYRKTGRPLSLNEEVDLVGVPEEFFLRSRRRWDKALKAVKDDPERLRNVEAGAAALDYTLLERLKLKPEASWTAAERTEAATLAKRMLRFLRESSRGYVRLAEWWPNVQRCTGDWRRLAGGVVPRIILDADRLDYVSFPQDQTDKLNSGWETNGVAFVRPFGRQAEGVVRYQAVFSLPTNVTADLRFETAGGHALKVEKIVGGREQSVSGVFWQDGTLGRVRLIPSKAVAPKGLLKRPFRVTVDWAADMDFTCVPRGELPTGWGGVNAKVEDLPYQACGGEGRDRPASDAVLEIAPYGFADPCPDPALLTGAYAFEFDALVTDETKLAAAGVNLRTLYAFTPDVWYHFRFEVDGGAAKVRLNGRVIAEDVKVTGCSIRNLSAGAKLLVDDVKAFALVAPADYPPAPVRPKGEERWDVIMNVCSLWYNGRHAGWHCIDRCGGPRPVLGYYDEGLPETADWEIKYMVDHGVDVQAFCWYAESHDGPLRHPSYEYQLRDGFKNARYSDRMKYCLIWEIQNAGRPHSLEAWKKNYVPYLIEHHFKDPRYYAPDGKPMLAVFGGWNFPKESAFGSAVATKEAFDYLEAELKKLGFKGLVTVSSNWHEGREDLAACGFSARCAYNYGTEGWKVETQKTRNLERAAVPGAFVIPTVSVGYNSRPWHGVAYPMMSAADLATSLAWVRDEFMPGQKHAEPWQARAVWLSTWNEYGEGTYMMPCDDALGFGYLDAVRSVFTDESPDPKLNERPTPAQRTRLCHLYPAGK